MRTILITVALAGCPSGTYHSEGSRPPGWCPTYQDGVTWVRNANNECVDPREGDRRTYRIEPPKRDHIVTEERGIDGVAVRTAPVGGAAWNVSIENNTDNPMSVLWDESSFVVSSGEAAGRLIRGETRKLDTAKSQPPEPIPAHAKLVQTVFAEKLLPVEEIEEKWQGMDLRMAAIAEARGIRAKRNALLVGGKLSLTIDVAGTKKTWTGVVVSNAAASSPSGRSD
ncbi:MAG TPA: hypothetical protein VG994_02705 [Steroidobacteraceae bacterium]|nr:hypothetical protein [Steroidobacteraceae bacterium]